MNYLQQELYELFKADASVFEFLQTSALDGLWYWDLEHPEHEWMNARFWTTLGYDPAQMPHTPAAWQGIIHQEDLAVATENFRRHCADPTHAYDQVVRYRHQNGSTVWIRCRGMAIRNAEGVPLRMLGAHVDITSEKRKDAEIIEHQRSQLTNFFLISKELMSVFDLEGNFTRANQAWEAVIGYPGESLAGKPFMDFVHPDDVASTIAAMDALVAGQEVIDFTNRYRHQDGSYRFIEWRSTPRDGKIYAVARDITERMELEQRLRASEAYFRALIEHSHDLLIIATAYELKYVSPNVQQLLGYTPEAYATIPPEHLIHPDDLPLRWDELTEPGVSINLIYRHLHIDGSWHWMEGNAQNLTHLPHVGGIVFNLRDVTGRKQQEAEIRKLNEVLEEKVIQRTKALQQSEEMLKNAQQVARLGSWEMNVHTGEVRWSETLYDIMGFDPASPPPDFMHQEPVFEAEDFAKLRSLVDKAIREGVPYEADLRIFPPNASPAYILAKGEPSFNERNELTALTGIAMDITARKQAEVDLRQTTVRLESANRALETFAYSVSHDLRAPLRGIDGWSLALLEDYGDTLDEQAMTYINRVRGESQRMGELIDDMLKLSRISRSEVQRTPVNLTELAGTIMNRLQVLHPERKIRFSAPPGIEAFADPRLLTIVLENLLNNAVKFSARQPEAVISLEKDLREGVAVYCIRDNGAGFNLATAKNLFGAFQRFHRQSEFPGTGIGLAIVQRIIHLHEGNLWAESSVNQGAAFFFTLQSPSQ